MTINTRRLRASLPAVSGPQPLAREESRERPYVLWLLIFLPIAAIFAFHFLSGFFARS
jgi:hypothetical protein